MKKIPVYTIDSGVPIPEERQDLIGTYPINKLEVGDSILLPLADLHKMQITASRLKAKSGKKFTTRTIDEESARIWRTA